MQARHLTDYLDHLTARGRLTFARDEAMRALGIGSNAFLAAADRAARKGLLLHPKRGFYVVVAPQYRVWGAPPLDLVIDDLMRHEGAPYYVALLKAAQYHGAAHQAVMEYQVITTKRVQDVTLGRGRLAFYHRAEMPDAGLLSTRGTDAGPIPISGAALTAVDLLRYPAATGSLDAAATVVADLADAMDPADLARLAAARATTPSLQRLGYVLDKIRATSLADTLHDLIASGGFRKVELDTFAMPDGTDAGEVDERWKVVVRRELEIDHDSEELHP